jgi:hypothetical protein
VIRLENLGSYEIFTFGGVENVGAVSTPVRRPARGGSGQEDSRDAAGPAIAAA